MNVTIIRFLLLTCVLVSTLPNMIHGRWPTLKELYEQTRAEQVAKMDENKKIRDLEQDQYLKEAHERINKNVEKRKKESEIKLKQTIAKMKREKAQREACNCPPIDGTTEAKQLKKLWETELKGPKTGENDQMSVYALAQKINLQKFYGNITNQTSDISEYKYTVSSLGVRPNRDGLNVVRFLVIERFQHKPTKGGATFKVSVRGDFTRAPCSYNDQFNGNYLICCVLHEAINSVEIVLKNVNFFSYKLYHSQHKVIGSHMIPSDRPNVDKDGNLIALDQSKNVTSKTEDCFVDKDFWLLDDKLGWRYVSLGRKWAHTSREQANECLNNQYNGMLIMNGDSHLRYEFFYAANVIRGNETPKNYQLIQDKKDLIAVVSNNTYLWSSYKDIFKKHVHWMAINPPEVISDMTKTHIFGHYRQGKKYDNEVKSLNETKALVLMGIGTWDLAFNNASGYVAYFPEIAKELKLLLENDRHRVFWQNIPPWATQMEHVGGRHTNTFMNGAVNKMVEGDINELSIPIIDIWKMALSFQDKSSKSCGVHYLCKPTETMKWEGYPGAEATHLFLKQACLT